MPSHSHNLRLSDSSYSQAESTHMVSPLGLYFDSIATNNCPPRSISPLEGLNLRPPRESPPLRPAQPCSLPDVGPSTYHIWHAWAALNESNTISCHPAHPCVPRFHADTSTRHRGAYGAHLVELPDVDEYEHCYSSSSEDEDELCELEVQEEYTPALDVFSKAPTYGVYYTHEDSSEDEDTPSWSPPKGSMGFSGVGGMRPPRRASLIPRRRGTRV